MMKAIITGISRGLGKAIALKFAKNNIEVWGASRNTRQFENAPENIHLFDADLATKKGCEAFIEKVKKECGCPNIFINNLGVYETHNLLELDENMVESALQKNFFSAFRITQAFLAEIKARKEKTHVFNICSIVNIRPRKDCADYCLSKDLLRSYTTQLRLALKEHNANVIAVLPAAINTSSWGDDATRAKMIQPEDLADLILHNIQNLCSGLQKEMIIENL